MSPLIVRIVGDPVAQGRPRFTTRGGFPQAYDPPKSRAWKRRAAAELRLAARGTKWQLYHGPVQAVIVAVSPLPKSAHRLQRQVPRQWNTKRNADCDNLAKAALDSCTDAGLWLDDAQVVRLLVEKWIGAQDEAASVLISVGAVTRAAPDLDWLKSPYVGLVDYEPEEPPRHAIACENHGWYRGALMCPKCWEEARERRSAAAALRALERQPRDPRGPQPTRRVRNANALRQLAKTHCPRKHPYDTENTYRDHNGYRSCRTCKREREARRYLKRARGLE